MVQARCTWQQRTRAPLAAGDGPVLRFHLVFPIISKSGSHSSTLVAFTVGPLVKRTMRKLCIGSLRARRNYTCPLDIIQKKFIQACAE